MNQHQHQPQYGAPMAPGYPNPIQPQQGNGIAVAALVLGICSLVFFWIPFVGLICGVLGGIFGFVGMSKANERQGKGKGLAIAGLVTGIIGTLVGLWIVVAIFIAANEVGGLENL